MRDVLSGLRILLVEDDFLIAEDLARALAAMGATVVGPFATVGEGVDVTLREDLDGAVLDVGLAGRAAYPIADNLRARNLPFLFVTGHDASVLAERYRTVPQLRKPFRPDKLRRLASAVFGSKDRRQVA